jgi:hypothetical protein
VSVLSPKSNFSPGLKRKDAQSRQVKRAKPLTIQILRQAIDRLDAQEQENNGNRLISLKLWRTIWRMHVSFFCFLRWDDLCRLHVSDLEHLPDEKAYKIHLRFGKTNQMNVPSHRLITQTGGATCPYELTTR